MKRLWRVWGAQKSCRDAKPLHLQGSIGGDAFILQINAKITETRFQIRHLASTQQKNSE